MLEHTCSNSAIDAHGTRRGSRIYQSSKSDVAGHALYIWQFANKKSNSRLLGSRKEKASIRVEGGLRFSSQKDRLNTLALAIRFFYTNELYIKV
jgi:hypothetical protein